MSTYKSMLVVPLSRTRGFLVTMMSKTTTNKITEVIKMLIQQAVANCWDMLFSIQMDTTQDLISKDQCAVVLWYVTDEQLIDCESSTGQYFVDHVTETLEKMDIDIKSCGHHATNGAANMQGQYRGFSVLLTGESLLTKNTYSMVLLTCP